MFDLDTFLTTSVVDVNATDIRFQDSRTGEVFQRTIFRPGKREERDDSDSPAAIETKTASLSKEATAFATVSMSVGFTPRKRKRDSRQSVSRSALEASSSSLARTSAFAAVRLFSRIRTPRRRRAIALAMWPVPMNPTVVFVAFPMQNPVYLNASLRMVSIFATSKKSSAGSAMSTGTPASLLP